MKTLFDKDLSYDDAKKLIERGIDTITRDEDKFPTPLHGILNIDVAKTLILYGADVNVKNYRGQTPLHVVKNEKIAELFIKRGADVNALNYNNATPLFNVTDISIAKLLIKHGVDINIIDNVGQTALYGVRNKNIAKLLINAGANINVKDNFGFSPLHYIHDINITRLLIENGAIPNTISQYQQIKDMFTEKQQNAFDTYQMLSSNDEDFFQMCLAYQNGMNNNVRIDFKDMDIL